MEHIVIAGASNAGLTTARELRRHGFAGRLTLVDKEADGPYRRPEVSKGLLSGALTREEISIAWPENLDLDLILDTTMESLDATGRELTLTHGDGSTDTVGFDGLVLATGCEARPAPIGATVRNVHTLRSMSDSLAMKRDLDSASNVVIVGGGFIGLEVASVARELGKTVTVVEIAPIPLSRILGDWFGSKIGELQRSHGVNLLLNQRLADLEVDDTNTATAVILNSGERIPADLILMAVGSRPAISWLESSGLPYSDGIECDETCAVLGVEGIVAAGDVASWINPLYNRRMRVEHWTNAIEQGAYVARRLLGVHDPRGFVSAPYFWSDQHGSKIQSIGSSFGFDETVVLSETDDAILMAYGREGRLISIAGMNVGTTIMKHRAAILDGVPLSQVASESLSV